MQASRRRKRPLFSAIEVGRVCKYNTGTITMDTEMRELEEYYNDNPRHDYLPVVGPAETIVGYIQRSTFKAKLGQSDYSRNILLRPGYKIAGHMEDQVALIDSRMYLPEAVEILMSRPDHLRYDPFVILHHGRLLGIGSVKDVMRGINYYQTRDLDAMILAQKHAASYANPVTSRIDFAQHITQLHGLGGDYCYFRSFTDDIHFLLVGDVSGKGVQAAPSVSYTMATAKALCEAWDMDILKSRTILKADDWLATFNRIVAEGTPPENYAATSVFFIDLERMLLKYYDFGGNSVFLRRHSKTYVLPKADNISAITPFFGMDPALIPHGKNISLNQGDIFFTYSDGLNEAKNPKKEEFGEERIRHTFKRYSDTPEMLIREMSSELEDFRSEYRRTDDLTMASFKIMK